MKIAALVRAEDRGLGLQSWEAVRALKPDRVMVVDMGELARGFPMHLDRYPGATVARYASGLQESVVRPWLDGVDVCFTIEAIYDGSLPRWCEEAGARLVCQVNPEFTPPSYADLPLTCWAPTPWRMSFLPEGTRVVPVPVADDRFPFRVSRYENDDQPLRVLHVAGHRAMADRNGTAIVLQALTRLKPPMVVTIISQDAKLAGAVRTRPGIDVNVIQNGVANYWDLYRDQDVLVLPRRYGGLSLQVQEAMAAGLAVVMSDAEPQRSFWPVITVASASGPPRLNCPGGRLPLTNARPEAVADALNRLAGDRGALVAQQRLSVEWAEAHRWSVMRSVYERELAAVVAR